MRPLRLALALALAVLVLAVPARFAPADDRSPAAAARVPSELTLSLERVVAFKDGHALFVRKGTATADAAGDVSTSAVPSNAVLGCLWAATAQGSAPRITARFVETTTTRERTVPCADFADLLRANVGRGVRLTQRTEGGTDWVGTVVDVLGTPAAPAPDAATRRTREVSSSPPVVGETVRSLDPTGPWHVVLDHEGVRRVVPVADVRGISGQELATSIVRREEVTTRSKRLVVSLGATAAEKPVELRLLHFGKGVRWIPTYRVSGALVADATLSLHGEVLDDEADLVDTELDLVVGVPSFRFADTASPLTLESVLRSTIARTATDLMSQRVSNAFSSSLGNEASEAAPAAVPDLPGDAAQDLFVHHLGKVTLGRGDRASYPLLEERVALRHVYTADVRLRRNERSGASSLAQGDREERPGSDPGASAIPVLHGLELAHAGASPWTTGAALVLEGSMPIAQGTLRYTSPGGKAFLPLTTAVDVPAKYEEVEISRVPGALSWNGRSYARLVKTARVTLRNLRREPSDVRVTLRLGGRAEKANRDGRIVLDDGHREDFESDQALLHVNNRSDIRWDATLAPGETAVFEAEFAVHVW